MSRVVVRYGIRQLQRGPRRIPHRVWIAVRVGSVNRRDRAPVVVMILGFPGTDVTIGQCEIEQAEQSRVLPQIEPSAGRNTPRYPVPCQRRAFEPEQADLGLLGGARARCGDAVTAESLYLIEVGCVLLAAHLVRRTWTKLRAVVEHKGSDISPSGRECEVEPRCEAILARIGALRVREIQQRCIRTIPGPQGKNGRGRGLSYAIPCVLAVTVGIAASAAA